MQKIEGKEVLVGDVLGDKYAFEIPAYQRPYSWEEEHAGALLDDLLDALKDDEEVSEMTPYFLGSIVLIKEGNRPESDIIDGQQRLTTLTLLIRALQLHADKPTAATLGGFIMEQASDIMGTKERFRLKVRARERAYFEDTLIRPDGPDVLLNSPKADTQVKEQMRTNLLKLYTELEKISKIRRKKLAAFIMQRTYLIIVSTPDIDSAFRIFSVMNDRGKSLTAADILKADIIGKVPKSKTIDYTDRWEAIEERLGPDRFGELFAHIRMINLKEKARSSVLSELRNKVKPADTPEAFVDDQLSPYALAFSEILETNYRSEANAHQINRSLSHLHCLNESDWIAPSILYLAKNRNSPTDLLNFFQNLDRLAMMMWLWRFNVNWRLHRYGQLLRQIENDEPLTALDLSAEEIAAAREALAGNVYHFSPANKRTVILQRLDEALSSAEATYDPGKRISVEHVLPQTPPADSEWLEWWPDQQQRENNLHRLGNLCLLNAKQNTAAKNYSFDKKKKAYVDGNTGHSPFITTARTFRENQWTFKEFEKHQQERFNALCELWRFKQEAETQKSEIQI